MTSPPKPLRVADRPSAEPAPATPSAALDAGALLDQVHDGVIVLDLERTVRSWNAAAERIYGYTAAEMIGRPVSLLYFADDDEEVERTLLEPLFRLGAHQAEVRRRRKDGSEIFIDLRLTVQRDEAGRPIGIIGCSNDVTERHRARLDEQRQGEELRLILDGMPAMVWYKDRENRILRANLAAAASVGVTPAALEGRSTYDLYPEGAGQYHRDDLEVIHSGRPKLGIVEPLVTPGGETRWLRTDKLPYRDARGEIIGVIVFAVDITEQKRAEAALEQARDTLELRVRERTAALAQANESLRAEIAQRQQAEQRLELALWATDLGMWDWDARTGRTVCDARWAEMLGYRMDAVPEPTALWEALTHPDDQAAVARAWNAHLAGAAPFYEVEQRLRTRTGEYRWVLTRGKIVERDAGGAAVRMAGTNRDITARKQIEEQAARHQSELAHLLRLQTVNCLAAELAHEINQPLGAIANYANGLAERLRQGQLDRAAMLEAAEHIGRQALRAGTVLQRLREFARKEAPRQRAADLNQLVESAAGFLEAEARRVGAALTLRLAGDLPPVLADPIPIEQVVVNLLRNGLDAIAAAGGRGEVWIATRRGAAGGVEVCVHDSGGGVPEAVRPRLFEPFFTTKATGLGMGLSISRSIVEAHGGRLSVAPLDGDGATFCVSLPAAS